MNIVLILVIFHLERTLLKNEKITKDPIMSVFLDELQYAMPRGPHAKWPEISDAMSTAFQESFTNAKTPEQAAKDAQVKS